MLYLRGTVKEDCSDILGRHGLDVGRRTSECDSCAVTAEGCLGTAFRRYTSHPMSDPDPRNDFPPVLTTAMAAELLQVHVEYLRRMVREGRIPCHRFPGGRGMRFFRDELLEWLAALPGSRSVGVDRPRYRRARRRRTGGTLSS